MGQGLLDAFRELEGRSKAIVPESANMNTSAEIELMAEENSLTAFRNSVATFDALLYEWAKWSKRVEEGLAFCKANPGHVKGMQWLNRYRGEVARVNRLLEKEGARQGELEAEIAGQGKWICGQCFGVNEGACQCWTAPQ